MMTMYETLRKRFAHDLVNARADKQYSDYFFNDAQAVIDVIRAIMSDVEANSLQSSLNKVKAL